jgi:hypothetical protein
LLLLGEFTGVSLVVTAQVIYRPCVTDYVMPFYRAIIISYIRVSGLIRSADWKSQGLRNALFEGSRKVGAPAFRVCRQRVTKFSGMRLAYWSDWSLGPAIGESNSHLRQVIQRQLQLLIPSANAVCNYVVGLPQIRVDQC